MRIGYDAKRAAANFTGLGNYSRFVVEGIAKGYPNDDLILYLPRARSNKEYSQLIAMDNVRQELPQSFLHRKLSALWRTWYIKKQLLNDNIALYHGLSNEIPIGIDQIGIPSIVTIHDLIFKHFPQYYKPIDRAIYDYKFKYASLHASHIVAVSECTKRDIVELYHIDPSKITVIYQGCHTQYSLSASDSMKQQVRKKYTLPDRFILNVGTIEERKNILLAVQAIRDIPEDIHLVIVGRTTPYIQQIMEYATQHKLLHRIHFLHNVAFNDLPAIYQQAEIFVYPSLYEGFGIPILEALNCGIPVIGATGSCLEEAGGPHSLYVAPLDHKMLSNSINKILENKTLRYQMIESGKIYAQQFDPQILAQQLHKLYQSLV